MKTGKFIKFDILKESKKLLRGGKTKVDREILLHALADRFVAAQGKPKA